MQQREITARRRWNATTKPTTNVTSLEEALFKANPALVENSQSHWERLSIVDCFDSGPNGTAYFVLDRVAGRLASRLAKILHPEIDPHAAFERFSQIKKFPACDWFFEFNAAWINRSWRLVILSDFCTGLPLNIYCRTHPVEKRLAIFKMIKERIGILHDQGISHGNLSFSNIFVKNDHPVFLDCGLEEIATGQILSPSSDRAAIENLYQELCLVPVLWGERSKINFDCI